MIEFTNPKTHVSLFTLVKYELHARVDCYFEAPCIYSVNQDTHLTPSGKIPTEHRAGRVDARVFVSLSFSLRARIIPVYVRFCVRTYCVYLCTFSHRVRRRCQGGGLSLRALLEERPKWSEPYSPSTSDVDVFSLSLYPAGDPIHRWLPTMNYRDLARFRRIIQCCSITDSYSLIEFADQTDERNEG